MSGVVHLSDYSAQGDGVRIACDQSWTDPAWGADPHAGLPEGVYASDDGRHYTFTAERVTCEPCHDWMATKGPRS